MTILRGIGVTSVGGLFTAACGAGPEVEVAEGIPVETQAEALSGNALSPAQAKTATSSAVATTAHTPQAL